jgi:hypothetical protein
MIIAPPLVMTRQEIDEMLRRIRKSLDDTLAAIAPPADQRNQWLRLVVVTGNASCSMAAMTLAAKPALAIGGSCPRTPSRAR